MALSDAMSLFAVITTRELACLLTVSQEAVQRRVRDGELPSWRLMDADGHALMHGLLIGWRAARASIEEQYAGRTDEVERRLQWLADIRAGALAAPVIEHTGQVVGPPVDPTESRPHRRTVDLSEEQVTGYLREAAETSSKTYLTASAFNRWARDNGVGITNREVQAFMGQRPWTKVLVAVGLDEYLRGDPIGRNLELLRQATDATQCEKLSPRAFDRWATAQGLSVSVSTIAYQCGTWRKAKELAGVR
jgi:hypothetical protein